MYGVSTGERLFEEEKDKDKADAEAASRSRPGKKVSRFREWERTRLMCFLTHQKPELRLVAPVFRAIPPASNVYYA